jgi:hypothetical protein
MAPLRSLLAISLIASGGAGASARTTIQVPGDQPTLARAIAAAHPGDTILLAPGTYSPSAVVPRTKHGLTIRGANRNTVVFDGHSRLKDAIDVLADGVTIENLSAHSYLGNVFSWADVHGFGARYLTVWNILGYGLYAEASTDGVIEQDYVSGAADAAYYIGECNPCRSTIRHVVGALSAVGYSGTNASGGIVIRDSVWDRNGAGIVPNSYANEANPPQERARIAGNTVTRTGTAPVPLNTPLAAFHGVGIAVAGGRGNVVTGNRVSGSVRYGIAVFPTAYWIPLDPRPQPPGEHPPWRPAGNTVTGNTVEGSGLADLALAAGSGAANCFRGNHASTSAPAGLRSGCPKGSADVAARLAGPFRQMLNRVYDLHGGVDYKRMPKPPPQPSL